VAVAPVPAAEPTGVPGGEPTDDESESI
jgi:hypothetical protein